MKKALVIGCAVLIAALCYIIIASDYSDKTVIVLKDGSLIAADGTWKSGMELMYKIDDEIYIVEQAHIDRVEEGNIFHVLLDFKNCLKTLIGHITSPVGRWLSAIFDGNFTSTVFKFSALMLMAVLVTVLTLRFVRSRPNTKDETLKAPPPPDTKPLWPPSQLDVVRFFLNLYRVQLGAASDARIEFSQLAGDQSSASEIYELRVRHQGDWVSRRMTIGPLGEESGSKSKCYYVIYDVHLVVKIPAQPFDDFDKYIASMEKESKIVDKLAPKECIIPKVSVILGLIHSLSFIGEVSAELIEEKYVEWLRKSPENIEYLKINSGFVYFMDLSKYYFLGNILNGLHDLNEAVPAEIQDNPEIIWEPAKFKGRYGEENETVCFEIREVYNKCESEIHALVNKAAPGTRVTPFNIQTWFLTHLANQRITVKGTHLTPELIDQVNKCISAILSDSEAAVYRYRDTIRSYVGRLRAEQDKLVMGSISTNLMELLAWLWQKRIAMRDLKPDNLLVAGDPQKYPHFLRTASQYSLGIIDVETAVDYEVFKHRQVKQPLLGGTPFYATPSHFIRNQALAQTYGNLGKILHLQDWYAVMVMIYKVITGGLLFDNTAKLFADIKNKIVHSNRATGSELDAIESISRQFWRSAGLEFQTKIRSQEAALKTIQIAIPVNAARLLISFLKRDIQTLDLSVKKLIHSHPLLAANANREMLLNANHGKICALANDIAAKSKQTSPGSNSHAQILTVFNKIANQKMLLERKQLLAARLVIDNPQMTAYELMIVLFNTVLKAMYKEEWQSFKPAATEPVCQTDDEVSLATTI